MTTRAYLASLGVTMNQAHDFVKANLGSPATIYKVAQQYGIDSQMLADIMSIDYPGLTASGVESFFQGRGFNGAALHSKGVDNTSNVAMLSSDFTALSNLFGFNTHTGALSNEALRASVTKVTGVNSYLYAFAPINFDGAEDGVFTGKELGVSNFPSMAATWQNIESVFYGTVIRLLESIDQSEIQGLEDFVTQNETALSNNDATAMAHLQQLIINMFETPAVTPLFSEAELAQDLSAATTTVVQLMGQNNVSNIFSGFFGSMVTG